MELSLVFIISAFVAGVITFLAPCTLPLVPAYLGFISGVETKKEGSVSTEGQQRIIKNGALFILGFSIIFVLFGSLAGLAGQALAPYRLWLTRIGGLFVIIFGLFMLGVFNISFLKRDFHIPKPAWLETGTPLSSLVVGGTFALGWTPCVGPILGSILLLAGAEGTALTGALLLGVFSLGLAVPFILVAVLYAKASHVIAQSEKYLVWINRIGGVFLILLGLLLLTNNFSLTIEYGYRWFDFLEYDALQQYL